MPPVLRINDVALRGGNRRVAVEWQDDRGRRAAVAEFAFAADPVERQKIRWYLEDYPQFTADPAPQLAREAEAILADIGARLFSRVFAGRDAMRIWELVRSRLGEARVEVDADPSDVPGLPWELLRDPATDSPLALAARAFVRTHLQAAGVSSIPMTGDALRVLMVICRPGGAGDVPFRSVASRLVRGGTAAMASLDLDVLRPPTFARLHEALSEAADAGRPYHVVHFDGHGGYYDLADRYGYSPAASETGSELSGPRSRTPVAAPVRPGPHGYLTFEDPSSPANQQPVDGAALGQLLFASQVPVLCLNSARSAYAEAPDQPDGADLTGAAADIHARIRAYGSLAAEVADAGVPGVVAMGYSVYVVTAAQYTADLYAHLLAGRSLGEAATAARRGLASDPVRQIGAEPVTVQDWVVPVIYESAPLTLVRPEAKHAPVIHLSQEERAGPIGSAASEAPRPPDAGFFGRDETLLALDRAFDTNAIVLLHAFAGAGKTATAAEFARWYQATGGLTLRGDPAFGDGVVLWSSFEHHLPTDRLIFSAGDHFAGLLEASGIHWPALDPARSREVLLQVLAQVPALWVWDNVEPVTGFPPGAPSAWTRAEQDELAGFLRELGERTRCKVLLTSRREERGWLGTQPARVRLPSMPMRERQTLAAALAARQGPGVRDADWRPLLRFSEGNPLTITVLVGQALREGLTTGEQITAFVEELRAGQATLEAGQDVALGRSRSLEASLFYGFSRGFTDAERGQLALLHLFRGTVDVGALRFMGDPEAAGEHAIPQLSGLTREAGIALLDRAAGVGLLTPLGSGYYAIHPALPWFLESLFASTYPRAGTDDPALAYTRCFSALGQDLLDRYGKDQMAALSVLRAEESNLVSALARARAAQRWDDAIGCMQGLRGLYRHDGRNVEWARLVTELVPEFTDPVTGGPRPGREEQWPVVTDFRVRLARDYRDWDTALRLQQAIVDVERERAAGQELTSNTARALSVALESLGHILRERRLPESAGLYLEALDLCTRVSDRPGQATIAFNLGHVYKNITELRDLDQAERWYQQSLDLRAAEDRLGRAKTLGQLGATEYERFEADRQRSQTSPEGLVQRLGEALRLYQSALDLLPGDAVAELATAHGQLAAIYDAAGDSAQAIRHYQESIGRWETAGDQYQAALVRRNLAVVFRENGRPNDSRQYLIAALQGFTTLGPGAAEDAEETRQLLDDLERSSSI
ncbi:MAG TPA: tetratricopeptide repeat protein [Streptosporangiaceae bacterium]|nr:tetratricopeptide repeat protein [Streptosporangiaceae bacterium]